MHETRAFQLRPASLATTFYFSLDLLAEGGKSYLVSIAPLTTPITNHISFGYLFQCLFSWGVRAFFVSLLYGLEYNPTSRWGSRRCVTTYPTW